MTTTEYVRRLINGTISPSEQGRFAYAFIEYWEYIGGYCGIGAQGGRDFGMRNLRSVARQEGLPEAIVKVLLREFSSS